jgi:addiction module RelE/StbE family toxin
MMKYDIVLTESAKADIEHFERRYRRIIAVGIQRHLQHEAETRTKKKKPLRENPLGPYELRIDKYRVFYKVEGNNTVKVVAVGHKEHNELFIRGAKFEL